MIGVDDKKARADLLDRFNDQKLPDRFDQNATPIEYSPQTLLFAAPYGSQLIRGRKIENLPIEETDRVHCLTLGRRRDCAIDCKMTYEPLDPRVPMSAGCRVPLKRMKRKIHRI